VEICLRPHGVVSSRLQRPIFRVFFTLCCEQITPYGPFHFCLPEHIFATMVTEIIVGSQQGPWILLLLFDTTIACYSFQERVIQGRNSFEPWFSRSNLLTSPPVMWRDEHLWNVSVLQRVHLSNPVSNSSNNKRIGILLHRTVRKCEIETLPPLNVYRF
jgi:hypothetical protein